MKYKWSFISTLVLTFAWSTATYAKINIVTSIPDFGSIAKEIGKEKVNVISLVRPTQDPHYVDAKPSFMVSLNKADMLLVTGMELEAGWLPPLQKGARNKKILIGNLGYVDCSKFISPMEVQSVNRAKGDIHPGGNPHYWIDPRNGLKIAQGIANELSSIDSKYAHQFQKNAEVFKNKLLRKMTAWKKRLAPKKGTKVVVYHNSWMYFLNWAQYVQVGALEPKPGVPPSSSHVAHLLKKTTRSQIQYVLQESFYPTNLSSLFAKKANATLRVLPTMVGAKGTSDYINLIDSIVKEITK